MRSKLFLLFALAVLASACTPTPPEVSEDYIIGQKVKDVSSLTSDLGTVQTQIAIYDKTVDRIHQFNLTTVTLARSLAPAQPGGEHAILYHQSGNYVIDIAGKYVGVYNRDGVLAQQTGMFYGQPKSAAFRPTAGYLVTYDDGSSVAMLKLDANGNVTAKWSGGPVLDNGTGTPPSISAGDVDDAGQLILGLSDNSIAVVDLDASMAAQSWQFTSFATTLTDIKWLAPVNGAANQIFVRSKDKLSLIDVATQAVLDSVDIDETKVKVKTSKNFDPHVMVIDSQNAHIYYVKNSKFEARVNPTLPNSLLSSRLSLANDTLTWVNSSYKYWFEIDQPNQWKETRTLKRWRLSDMFSSSAWVPLPNDAQLEITPDHIFELFNAKYGLAYYLGLDDGSKVKLEKFNRPWVGGLP